MRALLIIGAALALAGCVKLPDDGTSRVVGHPGGCTLYETGVENSYYPIYSTVCPTTQHTSWNVTEGKTTRLVTDNTAYATAAAVVGATSQ